MSEDSFVTETTRRSEAEMAFSATTSKKNLSGVRGRASRTGRKGPVMTPVDFLRGRAKKEYMKNSEVRVYNMYEEKVIPYDEFKELPVEKQVVLMTKWRDEIGTNNIIKDMKISRKKFYSEVLKSLGIETKPRGRRPKREEEDGNQRQEEEQNLSYPNFVEEGSFLIVFNGRYNGQAAANRLARLSRLLDADCDYEVTVEVRELATE